MAVLVSVLYLLICVHTYWEYVLTLAPSWSVELGAAASSPLMGWQLDTEQKS